MIRGKNAQCVMLPHSKAKVEFYQRYLELYLIILGQARFTTEINIYDVYCGRGVYDDGALGSAIRSYETIQKVCREHPIDKRIILHLNDKNAKFVTRVEDYFKEHFAADPAPCSVVFTHKDATKYLDIVYTDILLHQYHSGAVNFFFIDPYGYKDISKKMLSDIMNTGNSEILLFLPVSFMHRFTHYAFDKKASKSALPLRMMIDSLFEPNHPVRSEEAMDIEDYIRYLTTAFGQHCKCYTTSYSIERNASNKFALFFFSRNACGFENMLKIKWKMIDSYGFGYHLADDEHDLFHDFFREEQAAEKLRRFRRAFIDWLSKGPKDNRDIYQNSIRSGFLPKHANAVLRELQNREQLRISYIRTDEELKAKNTFKVSYHEQKYPTLKFQLLCERQK